MSWRLSVWFGEILRNIIAHAATSIATVLLATITIGAVTTTELSEATTAVELRDRLDRSGANVVLIEAPNQTRTTEGNLTTGRCLALNDLDGIHAAGTETVGTPIELPAYPGTPVTPVAYTGRLPQVLDPTINAHISNVWVSTALTGQLGISTNANIAIDPNTSALNISGTLNPTRAPETGARIYFPADPTQPSSRCWIELDPPVTQAKVNALATWFTADSPISARPLLSTEQLAIDPYNQYLTRPTRYMWIAAGAVLGSIWSIIARARRPELALQMTIGAERLAVTSSLATEITLTAAIGATTGTSLSVLHWYLTTSHALHLPTIIDAAVAQAFLTLGLGLAIANAAIWTLSHGSRLQALKNRE